MKILALLFFLLSQSGPAVAPNESPLDGAWLEAGRKMDKCAGKDVAPHEQWAQAAVLYFGKEHKFSSSTATVTRVLREIHEHKITGSPEA